MKLSHTEAFTQRSLYTKWFLHTGTFTHKSFYTEKSLHRGTFTRSNKLKFAAVLREKPVAGAFGNSLAPQKSRLFPTKFLFHELFSKNIRNIFLKQVPIQKLSSPHCDEMDDREIRRSRRGASALKICDIATAAAAQPCALRADHIAMTVKWTVRVLEAHVTMSSSGGIWTSLIGSKPRRTARLSQKEFPDPRRHWS